jgi:uncharacterized protein YoxC
MTDKNNRIFQDIDLKNNEINKLRASEKILTDDISILKEKLEYVKERIEIKNNELNARKRKIREIEKKLESVPEEVKLEKNDLEEILDKEKKVKHDIEQKLLDLISNRNYNELDPTELFFFDGQKTEIKANIIVNTVKIKYIEPPAQESKKLDKVVPKEATFRIDKKMIFEQLKKYACDYWVKAI